MDSPSSPSLSDEPGSVIGELHGHLLQDALAVIRFPQRHDAEFAAFYERRVHAHLQQWGAKQLPDPISRQDLSTLDRLEDLSVQSEAFIHDYLNKAVSSHLRQAYIQLPDWSHPSFFDVQNLPPRPHHVPILFDSLSEAERRRILKAFLRYEILSKIFRFCSDFDSSRLGPVDRQRQPSRLPCWSWDLLDHYECRPSAPWEIESIQCVWEYVRSLYGAISARFAGIPRGFPDSYGSFSLQIQWLLNEYFGHGMGTGTREEPCPFAADKMNNDFHASLFIKVWSFHMHCLAWLRPDDIIDTVSLWGLDRVERLLKSGTNYSECFFDLASKYVRAQPSLGWFGQNFPHRDQSQSAVNAVWANMDAANLALQGNNRFYRSLVRINRQRAWTFFDDRSRYPSTCRFPTLADLIDLRARDQYDSESCTEAGE